MSSRRFRRTAVVAAAVTATVTMAALLATGTNAVTASSTATSGAVSGTAATPVGEAVRLTGPRAFPTKGKVRIAGQVATQQARRPVVLQERQGRRWVRKGKKRTNKQGVFAFRLNAGPSPRDRTFRVTAPANRGLSQSRQKRVVKIRLRTPVQVSYSSKKPLLGKPSRVSGTVKGKARAKRKVVVQLKHWDGWKPLASGRTGKQGKFSVRVPSGWLYDGRVRVKVPGTKRGMARTVGATNVAVRPTWTPQGNADSWTFLGGYNRIRWNPCAGPITYRVNLDRAPLAQRTAAGLVHRAVREIAAGTGLRFKHLGTSQGFYDPAPGYPGHDRDTQLLIGWALDHETQHSFAGGTVGWGGGTAWQATDAAGPVGEFVSGGVVINAQGSWTEASTLRTLMHEIGHAVGLGHAADDQAQIMYQSLLTGRPNQWGAGDISGLHWVGRQLGCTSRVTGRGDAKPIDFALP